MAGLIDYKEMLKAAEDIATRPGDHFNEHVRDTIQLDIADSLEKLVEAQKPKHLFTKQQLEHIDEAMDQWRENFEDTPGIELDSEEEIASRKETCADIDVITALIAGALGSAEDKAGEDKN